MLALQLTLVEDVDLIRVRAGELAFTLKRQRYLFAIFAHPPHLLGGYTNHQRVGFYVFVHHRTSPDKGIFVNGNAANDGAVGTQRGAFFD